MNYLTPKVEQFSLHYDHGRAINDNRYTTALERLIKEAQSIEVAGKSLFIQVNDNAGVIDFTFVGEHSLKEVRHWTDLINIWFASFLDE